MPEPIKKPLVKRPNAKTLAEIAKLKAETKKIEVESYKTALEAEAHEIELELIRDKKAQQDASDEAHHVYRLTDEIGEATVGKCVRTLAVWSRVSLEQDEKPCSIELVIDSPGGEVYSGMHLFDFIQGLRRNGHKVTTTAMGMAASMAGILLQAGDVRRCGAEGWILIHQVSTGVRGKSWAIVDEAAFLQKMEERVLNIFAARAAASAAEKPFTKAQFRKGWERKDWWISSDEALLHGIVDEVV